MMRSKRSSGISDRYSALSILRHAATHAPWPRVWRTPPPKPGYDVIIIGGGGHGLATAYYLAANHGINKVAVLERGYIGS
jgi:sarcosine oxidase subunit beta